MFFRKFSPTSSILLWQKLSSDSSPKLQCLDLGVLCWIIEMPLCGEEKHWGILGNSHLSLFALSSDSQPSLFCLNPGSQLSLFGFSALTLSFHSSASALTLNSHPEANCSLHKMKLFQYVFASFPQMVASYYDRNYRQTALPNFNVWTWGSYAELLKCLAVGRRSTEGL